MAARPRGRGIFGASRLSLRRISALCVGDLYGNVGFPANLERPFDKNVRPRDCQDRTIKTHSDYFEAEGGSHVRQLRCRRNSVEFVSAARRGFCILYMRYTRRRAAGRGIFYALRAMPFFIFPTACCYREGTPEA